MCFKCQFSFFSWMNSIPSCLWNTHTYMSHLFIHLSFFNIKLFILIGGWLLYNIVLVLPYINMNPPQVYKCFPSWTLLPPPSPYHPSRSSQCTSPKHPVSCIEPGLSIHFLYDILHVIWLFIVDLQYCDYFIFVNHFRYCSTRLKKTASRSLREVFTYLRIFY